MGQTIVILNDAQLAYELFDKRSVKHSSRPSQVMTGEMYVKSTTGNGMVGLKDLTGLLVYGERLRVHRKNMSRIIGSKTAASQYDTLQEAEVGHFLLHLLDDPSNLLDHIKRLVGRSHLQECRRTDKRLREAGSLILKIAYGYTAEPFKADPLLDMIEETMDNFAKGAVPGAFLVDVFPFRKSATARLDLTCNCLTSVQVRYLPEWVPGTGFKQIAKRWRAQFQGTRDTPYAFVEHQMAQGKDNESFLAHLLESSDPSPENDFNNKHSAMALYGGGADTTVSSIATFFLAMMVYPEVQQKAQAEIDRVVGQERLPNIHDLEKLPYIEAVAKELMRWHPIGPMGLPHSSTEDDIFEGYFIPKGAMVFPNIWHFTHDPERYPDPMGFKPERFLASEGHEPEADPHKFVFGFGRRICPGRNLAENSIFLTVAQTLAVYSLSKPVRDGRVVEPSIKFTPGVISHPAPFDISIKPRSPHHEKLIRAIEETYPWQPSDAKTLESLKV
ncbi:O-methylsterigmatocystin oxidoreductase [Colletotrichum liriopes]|uniref:O-methylsterigmatocystin oxidoreductase n=1 Tax=Colletotrichum liriopes TaxID=708192 RepID=A0AA37LZW6_9PEZI|nr:O-methylsterigmatocystin oxidoreductase [Colletotrichum liriopes]